MFKKKLFSSIISLAAVTIAYPQNVSSPYSILGIGDIDNTDYGRYAASGNAAVSRRDPGSYNFANPASLTAIPFKTLNFDFSFRGRTSKFKEPGAESYTGISKDFIVKRVSLAFKVSQKTAFAFGIKPFSSVNYQYIAGAATGNSSEAGYEKYADGSGGINQVYFSLGRQINSRLSAGLTASWLFGSLQHNVGYYNESLSLDVIKKEGTFYYGAGIKAALQYEMPAGKTWRHIIGLTADAYSSLQGEKTVYYYQADTLIKYLPPEQSSFRMPVSIGLGYSLASSKGLSFHLQGTYQHWVNQNLHYQNSYIQDAWGFNAGIEYSKRAITDRSIPERYFLALGFRIEQSYLVTSNNPLVDYAVTLGGGRNISRFVGLTANFGIGRRGRTSLLQIEENYYQFSIGLVLKDLWFGTKKLGRFY